MDYVKEIGGVLNNVVAKLKEDLASFRSNRPTTKIVENIRIDYMGTDMELRQLAAISIEPPRDIVISPWDKSTMPQIEKAIQDAKIGLSPSSQGTIVRVKLPDLTDERKKELVKLVKTEVEEARIKVRMTRDEFNKKLKDLPEDQKFKAKEGIQKQVDRTNEQIEMLLGSKLKEIEE